MSNQTETEVTQLSALVLAQQHYINLLEKQSQNDIPTNIKSSSTYDHHGYYYYSNHNFTRVCKIIDSLVEICSDCNIILQKCEVCGRPDQHLVGYGIPMMDCCRNCYPPGFTNGYQVVYYEELYTDKSKYLGTFETIEEAHAVKLNVTGYKCIFNNRKMINKKYIIVC
jgi:hypothetical protein